MSGAAKKLFSFGKSRGRRAKAEPQKTVLGYKQFSSHRRMSLVFLFVWLVLIAFGLMMMFSASYGISFVQSSSAMRAQWRQSGALDPSSPVGVILEADATKLARKQALYTVVSAAAAIAFAMLVPFRQLTRPSFRWIIYVVITFALLYTIVAGQSFNGAKRWLTIAGITFQPSELAKIGSIFFLASYFSDRRKARLREDAVARASHADSRTGRAKRPSLMKQAFKEVAWPGLLMFIWIGMIVVQPHLSGAIILASICLVVFFFAQMPLKIRLAGFTQLLVIVLIICIAAGFVFQAVTQRSPVAFVSERFAHASRRLDTFQNRDAVSEDDRMQIEQAEIALGSGGLTGKGLGKSVQKLNWLSEAHNDFILSVIGEELGFLGVVAVIVIFIVFLVAGLYIAKRAATHMAMLVAAGYTFMIVWQAFLNMAVAASLIPATGISLPFFSYGGTANIFFSLAAGLVLCVSKSGTKQNRELARILDSARYNKDVNMDDSDLEDDDAMGYAV
ncbi:MAG TPA: FtsW/RodA/SpoVE family cell cycle protein [Clostridiaceae bacterium]|nr:FtsW/RodA/SpoVE family cell cycle protein [Clostridiaceae bacterium]